MSWPFIYGVGVGCMTTHARRFLRDLWIAPPPDGVLFPAAFIAGLLWPVLAFAWCVYRLAVWVRGRRG